MNAPHQPQGKEAVMIDEQYQSTQQLGMDHGFLDTVMAAARTKIRMALQSIADADTGVDSGVGTNGMDFWVTLDGKEYLLTARFSKNQLMKERQ